MQPPIPPPTGDAMRPCPRCGAVVARNTPFCPQCGERLTYELPRDGSPRRTRSTAEGCLITVLIGAIAVGGLVGACSVMVLLDAERISRDIGDIAPLTWGVLAICTVVVLGSVIGLFRLSRKK